MSVTESGLERWLRGATAAPPPESVGRIGLLAHASSIDARGNHALPLLLERVGSRVVRLFAPEHGIWGHEQDMEGVAHATEPSTGLPVVSLYGDGVESLAPDPADLADLDLLVCDLQDVGSRYYTYVYTLSYLMEAAREADLPVLVLDRPNPIGGLEVEGPVLREGLESFVGRYPLPPRHGMTIGELARLFNERFGIGCSLEVAGLGGWRRSMEFAETALPWVPPSPNMPTPSTARVYPGGCLVEGTNLSEGRGTTTPFELVGAPWLDAAGLRDRLVALDLPGAAFRAASFRPMFQKHAGAGCMGVQLIVHDRKSFRPFASYWELLRMARANDETQFEWRTEVYEFESDRLAIDLLLGREDLRPALEAGVPHHQAELLWQADLAAFQALREPHLLYD